MNESHPQQTSIPNPALGAEAAVLSEKYTHALLAEDEARTNVEVARNEHIAGTIGGTALSAIDHQEFLVRKSKYDMSRHKESLDKQLLNTRERISKYTPYQGSLVEDYFTARLQEGGAPRLFEDWREKAGSTDWKTFIASDATDEQLTNILQWHSSRMEAINNSPETERKISALGYRFLSGIDTLAANGSVDETLGDRAQAKLPDVKVRITDVFDLQVEGRTGYTHTGGNTIFLGEDFNPKTFYHEMLHQVITEESRHEGWSGKLLLKAIVDEAIVDNLAMSIYRRFDSRMPLKPNDQPQSYRNSKQLAAYQLSERFGHRFTEDEFVKDYTGPKKLYRTFLGSRVAETGMQDLNHEAKMLEAAGATTHSMDFDLAAGRVLAAELAREQRYQQGQAAASGMVIEV